jgi:hypothetical protein
MTGTTSKISGCMNTELLTLLENVKDKSLIGLSIQHALKEKNYKDLIDALQDMVIDNPQRILPIIGHRAFLLLKKLPDRYS